MLNKLIFLHHETVIMNDPGRETITAGLGPIQQYGIVLLALIVIGIIAYFIKRKKKKNDAREDTPRIKKKLKRK
ncbi:hypothetical protein LCGC14_2328960 [marine sediment metagenome]|uniref:Uncharacterized protein n=1 Tax=marine sediment metagenome TaxID=412755 RepID=A0A0F9FAG1_9ZZZZ